MEKEHTKEHIKEEYNIKRKIIKNYYVVFSDEKEFIFTKEQILLIPYFNMLITSSSFSEKDVINIKMSSVGFKYLHMYATMDEIDIVDPGDKYLFATKQCDYFGYDKLKILLEEKYGYKIDIMDLREKSGIELSVRMKYLGKFNITTIPYPMRIEIAGCICSYGGIRYETNYIKDNLINFYTNFINLITYSGNYHHCSRCNRGDTTCSNKFYISQTNPLITITPPQELIKIKTKLYVIKPVYEYPEYSTDPEISEIFQRRYRKKFNKYFVKMVKEVLILEGIICCKINDLYKPFSELTIEEEYKDVSEIVSDNEPKFNTKYFIKFMGDDCEVYENYL